MNDTLKLIKTENILYFKCTHLFLVNIFFYIGILYTLYMNYSDKFKITSDKKCRYKRPSLSIYQLPRVIDVGTNILIILFLLFEHTFGLVVIFSVMVLERCELKFVLYYIRYILNSCSDYKLLLF